MSDKIKEKKSDKIKYNMGCGFNKKEGFVNVDKSPECLPDLQMDLEDLPWKIESNSAHEVVFNHSMEHLGQDPNVFLGIIKELYRICAPNAEVFISAPHPRSDTFIADPTHVRAITPSTFLLFNKNNCELFKEKNYSNSPLAFYIDVDFELVNNEIILEDRYFEKFENKEITEYQLHDLINHNNNVAKEYKFVLKVLK